MTFKKGKQEKSALLQLFVFTTILSLVAPIGLFNSPLKVQEAKAQDLCEVAVDAVLITDTSGSMNEGKAASKCVWWSLALVGPSYQWVQQTDYNITEAWCLAKDQGPSRPAVYSPATESKLFYAKKAADLFLDNMGENDQSGVVQFNSVSSLEKGLSNDHASTKAVINGLTAAGSTNIGDAIKEGILELNSVRANPQANKVMILLTDGKANKPNGNGYDENPADIQYALDKATEANGLGYKIFTIGLGTDGEINQAMLTQIAQITGAKKSTGEPGYYHVPNGNTLSDIYQQIAFEICHYGSISGCKYEDKDNNGDILGEKALSGWEIALSGEMSATQTTDEQGCYSFAGLKPGNYTVAEGPNASEAPFSQTYPPSNQYQIALSEGEALTSQDFGNYLPVCGNNIVDQLTSEVCDGDSQQCEAEGGYSGMMSCKQDCSGYGDCITQEECGDGVKNGNEECDGQDGVVDNYFCNQNCILEYIPFCGDNEINQPEEECDGDSPKECQTQTGYLGMQECALCLWGVCEPNEFCGDAIVNGSEVCDSNERACQVNGYLGVQQCNSTCAGWEECTSQEYCGDNLKNGEEECDDGNLEDGDGCSALCLIEEEPKDYCINEGDLVINEIMQNPSAVSDNYGEWFEIYNPTLREIDLKDCIFSDQGIDSFTITGALVVASKGYLVLAQSPQSQNGGFIPDYIYNKANFMLDNWDDEIILTCEGVEVDKVFYDDGFTFPDPSGASMNLASPYLDNLAGANWCEASSVFGSGDLGTPKAGNDVCLGKNTPPELILHPASWTIANYVLGEVPPGNLFDDFMAKSGITAFDQEDGDLTSQIVVLGLAAVDVTKTGSYTIKITVEDSAGLFAKSLYREIYVRNPGTDYPARCLWDGTYNRDCSSGCFVPDEPGQEPEPPVNQPPLITLLGANPLTIWQGGCFIDPGATSSDPEDGDLTDEIVVSGDIVNTLISGTYTIVYSVEDSGGLTASTSREVVIQAQTAGNPSIRVCKILTDFEGKIIDGSAYPVSTFTIFGLPAPGQGSNPDYFYYDTSSPFPDTIFTTPLTLNADLIGGDGINDAQCFYYDNLKLNNYFYSQEQISTTTLWQEPLYLEPVWGEQDACVDLNDFNPYSPQWFTTSIDDNSIPPRIKSSDGLIDIYIPPIEDGYAYHPTLVIWNRLSTSTKPVPDPANQPPLITLLGANPLEIIKDSIFIDLGATSSDPEDGDLTSQIKTLGSVDTSIVGTYILTYSVHDSGGLGATTTRQVQVQNPTQAGNSAVIRVCKIITDEQSVISDGSQIDGAFTLGGPQRPVYIVTDSTSSVPTTVFQTPLVLNADLLGNDGINDAQCITYTNLPLSNYFFDREVVTGSNWLAPKYYIYKQNETPFLNDFDIFYDDWYTVTTTDDNIHKRSNGLVDMYPAGGPAIQYDQTVVIWNTMATTTPEDTGTSEEEDDGGCSGSCGGGGYTGGAVILFSENNVGGSGGTGGDGGSGGSGGEGDGGSSEGEDQCALLNAYLKQGGNNLVEEVRKLQLFLKDFEGFNEVQISGVFDDQTLNAVLKFQEKYDDEVLGEWGLNNPTGYVYITTKNKVNEIYCQLEIPLTEEEEEEIIGFKQTLGNLVAKDQEDQGVPSGGNSSEAENGTGNDQATLLGPLVVEGSGLSGSEGQEQGQEESKSNPFLGLIGSFGQVLSKNASYFIVALVLLLILAFIVSLVRLRIKKREMILSQILQASSGQQV